MTGTRDETPIVYRFGRVTVEPATFHVTCEDVAVKIEPKALEVLLYLIERRERVVAKQELLDAVWKGTAVTENALTRAIAQIRKVLGDDLRSPRFIQTIPTRGYRFIAELDSGKRQEHEFAEAPEARSEPAVAPGGRMSRSLAATAIACGVTVAILLIAAAISLARGGNAARKKPPRFDAADFDGYKLIKESAAVIDSPSLAARPLAATPLLQAFPTFSPDGRSVAYVVEDAGISHIYKRSIGAGDEVRLTAGDGETQPAWSPDGASIAFVSVRDGGILIIPAAGGTPVRVTNSGSRPSWSPDGREIAFQTGEGIEYGWTAFEALPPSTIAIVNVASKRVTNLTARGAPPGGHAAPSWRSDGMRLTFASCDLERCGIYSVARDGSAVEALITDRRRLSSPVYSRTGDAIVYVLMRYNDSVLLSLPVDPSGHRTGTPVRLRQSSSGVMQHVAMSRDGEQFAWTHVEEASDLYATRIDGSDAAPSHVTRNATVRTTFPAYSPDGSKITYCALAAGQDSGVWVADADGRNARALAVGPGLKQHAQWARSGWDVFYTAWSGHGPALFKVSLITGQTALVVRLPVGVSITSVSPDESAVAFTWTMDKSTSVWIMPITGEGERRLTADESLARFPVWSPDGKSIAVQIRRSATETAIGVVPVNGGPTVIIASGRGESLPYSWSPDGARLAFAARRNGIWDIYTVAATGGQPRRVTANDSMNTWLRTPAWSPDGGRILYESGGPRANIWVSQQRVAH